MRVVEAMRWSADGSAVEIIDQRALPAELTRLLLRSTGDVCDAIATLAVRGAPAIGITAAMGLVTALNEHTHSSRAVFLEVCDAMAARIGSVRPTAVNLSWAMRRMLAVAHATEGDAAIVHSALREEATMILAEDRTMCERIGEHGLQFIPRNARILTHCNAGALATGGIGTALAPIYLAATRGYAPRVFVDETRPLLQGSRLTAWELTEANVPATVIADNMAAALMRNRDVDLVIVGADRIAANGDVANKIGTYALAVCARYHDIPLYVAAPSSTIDCFTPTGATIVVEQRDEVEMRVIAGRTIVPAPAGVLNPAFDVSPAELITAIITDTGSHAAPYDFSAKTGRYA